MWGSIYLIKYLIKLCLITCVILCFLESLTVLYHGDCNVLDALSEIRIPTSLCDAGHWVSCAEGPVPLEGHHNCQGRKSVATLSLNTSEFPWLGKIKFKTISIHFESFHTDLCPGYNPLPGPYGWAIYSLDVLVNVCIGLQGTDGFLMQVCRFF